QGFAGLIHESQLDGLADIDRAGVGLLFTGNHAEQRRLAGAVRADDPDDGTGGDLEAQVVDQQALAVGLADVLEFDDIIAQALGHRYEDFLRFIALLVFVRGKLFEACQARLGLGLPAFGVLSHPFEFLLDGALTRRLGRLFLLQPVVFLLQPRTVVALPRNAVASIELEYPFGGIVQEIAVVSYTNDSTGKLAQELLQPFDAFGIKV